MFRSLLLVSDAPPQNKICFDADSTNIYQIQLVLIMVFLTDGDTRERAELEVKNAGNMSNCLQEPQLQMPPNRTLKKVKGRVCPDSGAEQKVIMQPNHRHHLFISHIFLLVKRGAHTTQNAT